MTTLESILRSNFRSHSETKNAFKQAEESDYIRRQSLLALLFAQVGAMLLHFSRLPFWLMLLAIVVLVWRVQIYRNQWAFPGRIHRICLVLLSLVAVVSQYQQWYTLEPMVTLLIIAFLLKLLEVEQKRDAVILIFVGFFVTVSAFLFDQGIISTLSGIVVLWILTACLLILHGDHIPFLSRRTLRTTSLLLLQAVPLMLLMLFVFPRIGALWSVPIQSNNAVTGISDSMSPGDFSNLTRSRRVAFRVSFDDDRLPIPSQRYWRALVLNEFDGRRWQRGDIGDSLLSIQQRAQNNQSQNSQPQYLVQQKSPETPEQSLRYDIVMEPSNHAWIYAIPHAEVINGPTASVRSITNELFLAQPATQRIQYRVETTLNVTVQETETNLRRALLLPRGFNPQTLALARQWRNEVTTREAYIQRVLNFYRDNFTYTLSPPRLGQHTADEFLLKTQAGFCEHFASSFVILMRAVGIPARVVTGYQGGEWNTADRYLIVRQYDAHAWAEVWSPKKGWQRIDPTAAVAPNRIEQGLLDSLTENDQSLMEPRNLPSFAWINRLALKWDSLNYAWQRWVLSYDQEQQSQWLKQLLGEITALRLAMLLLIPGALMLFIFGFMAIRDRPRHQSRQLKLYHLFIKRLRRRGLEIQTGETLSSIENKAIAAIPEQKPRIQQLIKLIGRQLYSHDKDMETSQFQKMKREIVKI